MSIDYLNNPVVKVLVENAEIYQKSTLTSLRKPKEEELDIELITYVKDNDKIRKESITIISDKIILARNLHPICENYNDKILYNEWTIPIETAITNYGQDVIDNLTFEYTNHKKVATLKGIELTQDIIDILGGNGNTLEIKVSWSDEPMIAILGDTLTDGGYSISKNDMKDYEMLSKKIYF